MTGHRLQLTQQQAIKRALPVMLPPGADEWCDHIAYVSTATADVPQVDAGPDYRPRGPVALVAVMPSARLPWVWAQAFALTEAAVSRRRNEEQQAERDARERARVEREEAITRVLVGLYRSVVPGESWPSAGLDKVRLPELKAMCRAGGISPCARAGALRAWLESWAAETVDGPDHAP